LVVEDSKGFLLMWVEAICAWIGRLESVVANGSSWSDWSVNFGEVSITSVVEYLGCSGRSATQRGDS